MNITPDTNTTCFLCEAPTHSNLLLHQEGRMVSIAKVREPKDFFADLCHDHTDRIFNGEAFPITTKENTMSNDQHPNYDPSYSIGDCNLCGGFHVEPICPEEDVPTVAEVLGINVPKEDTMTICGHLTKKGTPCKNKKGSCTKHLQQQLPLDEESKPLTKKVKCGYKDCPVRHHASLNDLQVYHGVKKNIAMVPKRPKCGNCSTFTKAVYHDTIEDVKACYARKNQATV